MSKKVWKNYDNSINVYVGSNKKAKEAIIAVAKQKGFNAVDLVDQVAIEPSKKSKLISKLNKELKSLGFKVVSNQVLGNSLKDYLSDYAEMSDSEELKNYLGKMGDQAEESENAKKATHNLKDCVENAERKTVGGREFSEKELDFLQLLNYIDSYEFKDLIAGHTSVDVLLKADDLEIFESIEKSTARPVGHNDLDIAKEAAGSGLLHHSMFDEKHTEPKKAKILRNSLLTAIKESGLGISDFAMWASSDEAGILADELYTSVPNMPLGKAQEMGNMAKNLFHDGLVEYIKTMPKHIYKEKLEEWDQKLGRQEPKKKKSILERLGLSEVEIKGPGDDGRRLESWPQGNTLAEDEKAEGLFGMGGKIKLPASGVRSSEWTKGGQNTENAVRYMQALTESIKATKGQSGQEEFKKILIDAKAPQNAKFGNHKNIITLRLKGEKGEQNCDLEVTLPFSTKNDREDDGFIEVKCDDKKLSKIVTNALKTIPKRMSWIKKYYDSTGGHEKAEGLFGIGGGKIDLPTANVRSGNWREGHSANKEAAVKYLSVFATVLNLFGKLMNKEFAELLKKAMHPKSGDLGKNHKNKMELRLEDGSSCELEIVLYYNDEKGKPFKSDGYVKVNCDDKNNKKLIEKALKTLPDYVDQFAKYHGN